MHVPTDGRADSKTPKFNIEIPGGGGARYARAFAIIPKPVDQAEIPVNSQIPAKFQIKFQSNFSQKSNFKRGRTTEFEIA